MLDSLGGRWKSEEAASIHSHEQTRAARIGALGNHQVAQGINHTLDAEKPELRSPALVHFFPSRSLFRNALSRAQSRKFFKSL
jgi:hypothetical protein